MSEPSEMNAIVQYHQRSKHGYHGSAPGPGYLDWENQPDPFRRYDSATSIVLDQPLPTEAPAFGEIFQSGRVPVADITFATLSQLFFDSLAISAWKSFQGSKWALRVNPSSGNLHPTEGYLIAGPLPGLSDTPAVYHYCPKTHSLEVRARFALEIWNRLLGEFPKGTIFIGLSSIHWREAWKYGMRAFRYCQHDLGHAVAAISFASTGLGWSTALLDSLSSEDLQTLLGLPKTHNEEFEAAECLLAVFPGTLPKEMNHPLPIDAFTSLEWMGTANQLSSEHMEWRDITLISQATRKPGTDLIVKTSDAYTSLSEHIQDNRIPLRKIIHQRRSAVAMDGQTRISQETFYQFLINTLPGICSPGFHGLNWEAQVHLGLFVHRVDGLAPGLYFLCRNREHLQDMQSRCKQEFLWDKPEICPKDLDLFLLMPGDTRATARSVSCGQEIASDGCFSLGMLSAFEKPLAQYGPWFYPRLYWECGAIGQTLYLQAEASGVRATGIGCFFDDPVHAIFGLTGMNYQSLYHFTVGGPVEDTRLTTLPPY